MSEELGTAEIVDDSEGVGGALAVRLQKLVMRAVDQGVGPVTGSIAYSESRLRAALKLPSTEPLPDLDRVSEADIERTINRIIKESVAASATNGFVTGLGGLVTMIVALPVNIAGALVINARLAGAVAYLRGYDLRDPHVQTFVSLASAGGSAASALSKAGATVGSKLTVQAIKSIPIQVIRRINTRVGFMLVAKYGTQRSVVTLAKAVPFVGGAVGGSVDAGLTTIVGRAAKKSFPREWGTGTVADEEVRPERT